MTSSYRQFFGLQNEPFTADIKRKDILVTAALKGVEERIHYALRIGGIAVVTGEIGSGKSTALRYVIGASIPPSTGSSTSPPPAALSWSCTGRYWGNWVSASAAVPVRS